VWHKSLANSKCAAAVLKRGETKVQNSISADLVVNAGRNPLWGGVKTAKGGGHRQQRKRGHSLESGGPYVVGGSWSTPSGKVHKKRGVNGIPRRKQPLKGREWNNIRRAGGKNEGGRSLQIIYKKWVQKKRGLQNGALRTNPQNYGWGGGGGGNEKVSRAVCNVFKNRPSGSQEKKDKEKG